MNESTEESGYLTGKLLVAMPNMMDTRFARSVIYICAHNADGAMGLMVNRLAESINFPDLLEQLEIEPGPMSDSILVHVGGPVEQGRGFVLHSSEYERDSTLQVVDEVSLTATLDILQDIAAGRGPKRKMLALGYAGWGPGQLDSEIQANGWLQVEADSDLLFGAAQEGKWERAIAKIGIDLTALSTQAGHA
jgi:putative transcriptional regulator